MASTISNRCRVIRTPVQLAADYGIPFPNVIQHCQQIRAVLLEPTDLLLINPIHTLGLKLGQLHFQVQVFRIDPGISHCRVRLNKRH
jgi:hypothetical protein